MKETNLYAERDVIKQGEWFSKHLMHMTSEELHNKADIAAELAHRDIIIDELVDALNKCTETLSTVEMNDAVANSLRYSRFVLDMIFNDTITI